MRVAFLGHNQPTDEAVRPAGGYLSKDDADFLVRELSAERISKKKIRAFPPDTTFRAITPPASTPGRHIQVIKLPPIEVGGCKFIPPKTDIKPSIAAMRAGWDWTLETAAL